VRRPPNLFHSVATEQLLQLSSAALRDISDWGWTLLSATAHHGALRASRGNIQRLQEYSRRVGDAPDGASATGASGRFHVELAAATQSVRISAAQIAYQADFGWLHALLLEDEAERARLAADAAAITVAVEARDPGAARGAAEVSAEASMHRILELRLEHFVPYMEDQR
jgi:DNA-binding FadR family transcriptional regulator